MSDDTTISLREYVDAMFTEKDRALSAALLAQEKAVGAALDASDKAINKAELNAEKWREAANEWRGAMNDRDRELPSRREVDAAISAQGERLALLEAQAATAMGRQQGIGLSAGVFIGGLTALGTALGIIIVLANTL